MKITSIHIYRAALPYVGGEYRWGDGNAIRTAYTSVVAVETDAGVAGCGEFCPCGENYMEAHSYGAAAAAQLLAPQLLGQDPRQVYKMERLMDNIIRGHGYAKSPFDIAFWDILAKSCNAPLWMLLGGKLTDGAPLYRVAPQKAPDEMRAEIEQHRARGYRQFQIKVGADFAADIERIRQTAPHINPGETAFADANQGWKVDEAVKVARATRDLDYVLEQPCRTYEECMQVRRKTDLPMKLDECITDFASAQRVVQERGAEIICLKIAKQGGLSKTRRMRDYLLEHRFRLVCEDSWGGQITTAAIAHLAASTPPEFLVNTTDLHNYNTKNTGAPPPVVKDGKLYASDAPGLGVEPDFAALGKPLATYAA